MKTKSILILGSVFAAGLLPAQTTSWSDIYDAETGCFISSGTVDVSDTTVSVINASVEQGEVTVNMRGTGPEGADGKFTVTGTGVNIAVAGEGSKTEFLGGTVNTAAGTHFSVTSGGTLSFASDTTLNTNGSLVLDNGIGTVDILGTVNTSGGRVMLGSGGGTDGLADTLNVNFGSVSNLYMWDQRDGIKSNLYGTLNITGPGGADEAAVVVRGSSLTMKSGSKILSSNTSKTDSMRIFYGSFAMESNTSATMKKDVYIYGTSAYRATFSMAENSTLTTEGVIKFNNWSTSTISGNINAGSVDTSGGNHTITLNETGSISLTGDFTILGKTDTNGVNPTFTSYGTMSGVNYTAGDTGYDWTTHQMAFTMKKAEGAEKGASLTLTGDFLNHYTGFTMEKGTSMTVGGTATFSAGDLNNIAGSVTAEKMQIGASYTGTVGSGDYTAKAYLYLNEGADVDVNQTLNILSGSKLTINSGAEMQIGGTLTAIGATVDVNGGYLVLAVGRNNINGGTIKVANNGVLQTTSNSFEGDFGGHINVESGFLQFSYIHLANGTVTLNSEYAYSGKFFLNRNYTTLNINANMELESLTYGKNESGGEHDCAYKLNIGENVERIDFFSGLTEGTLLVGSEEYNGNTKTYHLDIKGFENYLIHVDYIDDTNLDLVNLIGYEFGEDEHLGYVADTANGGYWLNVIPEPSTYAAIFGAIALGFVMFRRRK